MDEILGKNLQEHVVEMNMTEVACEDSHVKTNEDGETLRWNVHEV